METDWWDRYDTREVHQASTHLTIMFVLCCWYSLDCTHWDASGHEDSCIAVQIAKRQGVVNPENTFFSVKRFIGRKMAEVKDESTQVPYRLVDSSGAVKIKSANAKKDFSPEEISAQVLRKLVDDAAKFLNDKVDRCLLPCGAPCHGLARMCNTLICNITVA